MFVSRTDALRWLNAVAFAATLAGCATLESPSGSGTAGMTDAATLAPIEQTSIYGLKVRTTAPAQDVWERMRAGFAMPDLHSPLVRERELWYASRPETMLRMTERSRKYLFYIVEELERRNMPTELALLPFVESAYNPHAVSSAKAAGMWQFMPATGIDYSLAQNAFLDDRRDVLESTRAALDYLQKLHDMFGDWHLALAAYNWGEGSVGRARARNQSQGLPTGYLDLRMPQETRHYVPKLQAIKNIVMNPQAYGVQLADIGNHAYFDTVPIARDIDVARAAHMAGISEADFRLLNPAHKGPVVFAAATPEILLPWDNAQTFRNNLAGQREARLASWTVWTAPQRMALADVARHIGADEQELRALNAIPRNMLIDAGSALLVPRTSAILADATAEAIAKSRLKLMPEHAALGPARAARAGAASATSSTRASTTITVRKGDTLAALAKRHQVTQADLAKWNNLSRASKLKPGQKLTIAQAAPTQTAKASNAKASTPTGAKTALKATVKTATKTPSGKQATAAKASKTTKTAGKAPAKTTTKTASKTTGKNQTSKAASSGKSTHKTRVATGPGRAIRN